MTRCTNRIETNTEILRNTKTNRSKTRNGPSKVHIFQICALVLCIYSLPLVSPYSPSSSISDPEGLDTKKSTGTTIINSKPLSVNKGRNSDSTSDGILKTLGLTASLVEDGDNPADKTFFGEDTNGNPIVVGTWFQYGSYTLALAMFCTAFLVACAATAVYYVLFVVTEPSQIRSLSKSDESDKEGTLTSLLRVFSLAFDTYEYLNHNF